MSGLLSYAGAAVLAVLGLLHLIYTTSDLIRGPRYFRPRDRDLLPRLQQTQTAIAPRGHDFWTTLLGFHISHSIGVLMLSLMIVVATAHGISWLGIVTTIVSAAYALVAWRFWFGIPMWGCVVATLLLIGGLIV